MTTVIVIYLFILVKISFILKVAEVKCNDPLPCITYGYFHKNGVAFIL